MKMVKVVFLVSQGSIERMRKTPENVNLDRYGSFRKVFGPKDFGIVQAGDLANEIKKGVVSPVFTSDENFRPQQERKKGLEADLVLASSFERVRGEFPRKGYLVETMKYLESLQKKGDLGHVINSEIGTLSEDKKSLLEIQSLEIPVPSTFFFENFDELKEFLMKNSDKQYIVKPRFGEDGYGVRKIDFREMNNFYAGKIKDFLIQEDISIAEETRLIFFSEEFLGARRIIDRTRPWEKRKTAGRKHKILKYVPNKKEIEDSRKILKKLDITLGSVDWIYEEKGKRLFLEVNGVGTGYGYPGGPYNLNLEVAERLKLKYLN